MVLGVWKLAFLLYQFTDTSDGLFNKKIKRSAYLQINFSFNNATVLNVQMDKEPELFMRLKQSSCDRYIYVGGL